LPGMHAILALTNGIGALLNAGWLYMGLRRGNVLYGDSRNRRMVVRISIASVAMAVFLWWFGGQVNDWIMASTTTRVLWLAALIAGGAAIYFVSLWMLGARGEHFRLQPPTVVDGAVVKAESTPKA
jgi:putative peptidoglycan lipid II flippase